MWRQLGESVFEYRIEPASRVRLRDWLGHQGWLDEPPPGLSVTVVDIARCGDDRWMCQGLSEPFEGDRDWVLSEVEYRCLRQALRQSSAPAAVHGALVGRPKASLLLVGAHASGKTTMALALNRLGFPVTGDDIVWVDGDGRCRSLPRPLRVRGRSHALLDPTERERAFFDPVEQLLRIDPIAVGGGRAAWCHVTHVIFVEYREGRDVALEELPSTQAIPALIHHTFDVKPRTPATLDAVVAILADVPALRFHHGLAPVPAARWLLDEIRPT